MCHIYVKAPMVTNWFPYFLSARFRFNTKQVTVGNKYENHNLLRFKSNNKLVGRK